MHSLRFFLVLTMILALPAWAWALQGYVQPVGDGGTIAWGSGEVAVVRPLGGHAGDGTDGESGIDVGGESSSFALRLAATQARKQLIDMILAVRIDARGTVSAYLADEEDATARVRGIVQNSPLERPTAVGEAGDIRVFERLRGKLAEVILPTTIQFQSGIAPRMSTSMEQNMAFVDQVPEEAGVGTAGYTGVIVDARGLQVTPALAPVIYGQDGLGAYGPFLVSRANAIDKGVAAYAVTDDPASLRERVGDRPLVVRALSTFGSWRTDLVISSPMARLVRAMMQVGDAVDNCRVVIVLDPPAGSADAPGAQPFAIESGESGAGQPAKEE
ncbi:MAG: hypothetical protein KKD85_05855 [Proteobacteria bacterium]|uniref:Uncharacterized protein n=2 Tax=Pseudodesulfovibrio aespoeensis TaxID=182210 RepID=E6VZ21_PSEA9|nr:MULTISPECIES: hypothetical protein [Pseudodesulfovibrio]MBU4191837.1 hypothetical protein [Pseudomonadota bacterium]ADU62797.1 hypothetical protein Daes_1785 [Pseudodesulfovibrio aespoeensis Aspo-2]MBU4245307.1 hypothetical protein [Pseudomonadota bacterium]MBU4515733.1 hypothetical protein [Pseudomonadota bacterium]MBU4523324.1 hypothetical protein [Pseudomonadota bacterium]